MSTLTFLASAVVISLSGVMAPGTLTAATIAQGTRSKNAGALIAIGHAIIEIPLIFLLILGFGIVLKSQKTQIAIGFAGGGVLPLDGHWDTPTTFEKPDTPPGQATKPALSLRALSLSIGNPYFLLWWATVGLNLALKARALGALALVLFAIVHWLCDLVWLHLLAWTSFKGSALLSPGRQKIVFGICAVALVFFGTKFIYDATTLWFG